MSTWKSPHPSVRPSRLNAPTNGVRSHLIPPEQFRGPLTPSDSFHSLDSTLSAILTFITAALSYPTTTTLAHTLLQTSPPGITDALHHSLAISSDRRILGLGTVRCWSVAPAPASSDVAQGSKGRYGGEGMVVSVVVCVHPDVLDGEVLEITKEVWGRAVEAVGRRAEVSVAVRRGWEER